MQTPTSEPMEPSEQFCPNSTCCARGKIGLGNIAIHDRKRQRYRCKMCQQTFSARRGTMFEGLRTSTETVVIVVTLLAFGCPVQAIVQAYGLDERTVVCGATARAGSVNECIKPSSSKDSSIYSPRASRRDPGESARHGGLDGISDDGLDASVAGWRGKSHP